MHCIHGTLCWLPVVICHLCVLRVTGDEKGKFTIILAHICCLVPVEVGWVGRVRFQLFLGRSSGHKVPFMPCNGPNNYGEQGIQVFNRTLPRG